MGRNRNAYVVLDGKPEGKRQRRASRRYEVNVEMNLKVF
jgi:hypothetical protein